MQSYKEWVSENHPESLDEGWGKNLAVGAAIMGAGMGLGRMTKSNPQDKKINSYSVTSPAAASYLNNDSSDEINSYSTTYPAAASYLNNSDEDTPVAKPKLSRFNRNPGLKRKAAIFNANGRTSGTFVHGELQN